MPCHSETLFGVELKLLGKANDFVEQAIYGLFKDGREFSISSKSIAEFELSRELKV